MKKYMLTEKRCEHKKYMFTAKWCGNCQLMKPIVSKIKNVEIIDIDECKEYINKYTIMGLPTYIVDKGDEFNALSGIQDLKSLQEFYDG